MSSWNTWTGHGRKQDTPFPQVQFTKFPGSCMWGFKLPNKTSTGYQNTGNIAEGIWETRGCSKEKLCGCPSKQGTIPISKSQGRRNNLWGWPEPGEERAKRGNKNLQRELRCSAGIAGGQQQFYQSWARWLPTPGAEWVSDNAAISTPGFLWIYSSGKKQLLNP